MHSKLVFFICICKPKSVKKLNLSISIVFAFFFYSFVAQAQVENCPSHVQSFGNTQIQQLYSTKGKRCYFRVQPRDNEVSMVYRSFLLTGDGLFMVFNSYSGQFDETSDGAREFFFYPEKFNGFEWFVEGESLIVKGYDQRTFKFLLTTAQLQEMSGAKVKLANKVSPDNKGGLEILSSEQIYLDAGFRLGGSPSSNPNGKSVVKNPQGQSCKVPNGKAYEYRSGSAYLKPKDDLKQAVAVLCPEFVWP